MLLLKSFLVVTTLGLVSCCDKGFVEISDGTCLPYVTEYHGKCSDNAQCEWLGKNSECRNVCRCKKGYRWYLGECQEFVGLGEKCSTNIDCYDGYNLQSLTCSSGTCVCSKGYYQHGDTDCRKIASNINDICALDIDCQVPNQDTVCHIGKCQPRSQYEEKRGEKQQEDDEKEKETPKLLYLEAEKSCKSDDDCADPNSECFEQSGTCICKKAYFLKDGSCTAELGVNVSCINDTDCPIRPGKCEHGVCYCRDYYFVEEGNRNCIKTMSQDNWNCLSKEWCYAFGNYVYCSLNETCKCSSTAEFDEENLFCNKVGENDDLCLSDYDCKNITDGICAEEKCGCKKGFALVDTSCVPASIGVPCDSEVENTCTVEHSECSNGFCLCEENYVSYKDAACYLKSKGLKDNCEVDVQCSSTVLYALCLNQTCTCHESYIPHNGTCLLKAEYGSYCNNQLECILSSTPGMSDSIVCRNHECQCPTGFSKEGDTCSSGEKVIGTIMFTILLLKFVFSVS